MFEPPDRPLSSSPDSNGALLENLLLFGRLCKSLGMAVTPDRMIEAAHALALIDVAQKADFHDVLLAMMVTRQSDLGLFETAFRAFWRAPLSLDTQSAFNLLPERRSPRSQSMSAVDVTGIPDAESAARSISVMPTPSTQEVLRTKNFAEITPDEIAAAKLLMKRLPWSLGMRRTRRLWRGKGATLDMRRAFRQNLRYSGEMIALPTRGPKMKPRPLVVVCDISGSMERYTRLLLHFLHTLAGNMRQVEVFVFSTSLQRITRSLRHKSVDVALGEIGRSVSHWGGGTRIDAALHSFNYRWSRRVLGHGAVVLLITDGWDRGDAVQLQHEIAHLQQSCYRLVWLNPLLGDSRYQPLTEGAQALLPCVDDFLPVHNLASLDALARELWRVDWHRPTRSRYRHLIVKPIGQT